MGRRSRKRKPSAATSLPPAVPAPVSDRYARSRAKDEAVRQGLEPLADGERPGAVTVAAAVAALLALANGAFYLADVEIRGADPGVFGLLLFEALMGAMVYGLWRMRYWAVLGFQALLGVTILIAGLSLAVASNLLAFVLCLTILGLGTWLFWKLIKAMARIQIPERPSANPR